MCFLYFVCCVECILLLYECVGWLEEFVVIVEGFEMCFVVECGLIIVCLDISGSMMGVREIVVKVMVFECMW